MRHGAELVRKLLDAGWPEGTVLNVNFPDCEPDAVKGMCATVQGLRNPGLLRIDDRLDTRGKAYYWIGIAASPGQAAARHRSLGGALKSHLGHAALSRLYRPEDPREICQSLGWQAAIDFETVVENRRIVLCRL